MRNPVLVVLGYKFLMTPGEIRWVACPMPAEFLTACRQAWPNERPIRRRVGWMPWFGLSFCPALSDGRQDKRSQILSPIMQETGSCLD